MNKRNRFIASVVRASAEQHAVMPWDRATRYRRLAARRAGRGVAA